MKIRIAIALSEENTLENQHFGDAEKFLEVETDGQAFVELSDSPNPFKGQHGHHHAHHPQGAEGEHTHAHEGGHGSHRKARGIISFFQEREVRVLISRQFGKNIREVCDHFVPILVTEKFVEPTMELIHRHYPKILSELERKGAPHHILRLKEDDFIAIPLREE